MNTYLNTSIAIAKNVTLYILFIILNGCREYELLKKPIAKPIVYKINKYNQYFWLW